MMAIDRYKISIPDSALEDLSKRLGSTKFPSQLETGENYSIGSPVTDMERLTAYWREKYDWRKAEAEMNKLPSFRTKIDVDGFGELDVHFLHQASAVKGAIPLLFSHGWPGNYLEVTKLLPLLNGSHGNPAFHVVAPSLPNFGFSQGVTEKGFGLTKYAEVCHKLMLKLGYSKYVTQGGDWGFGVTRAMGLQYPEHCKASHLNLILALPPDASEPEPELSALDKAKRARTKWFETESYGYNLLQSTKPQTIGFALADSPVALLAWIYEKLHDWSDSYPWSEDEVLTWVSIYWFSTAGPEASVRIYHEATHPQPQSDVGSSQLRAWQPHVKLGLAHFPMEIFCCPQSWAEKLGPVVYQKQHKSGGHFAAWERPDAIAGDLVNMFGKDGACYNILEDRSGY